MKLFYPLETNASVSRHIGRFSAGPIGLASGNRRFHTRALELAAVDADRRFTIARRRDSREETAGAFSRQLTTGFGLPAAKVFGIDALCVEEFRMPGAARTKGLASGTSGNVEVSPVHDVESTTRATPHATPRAIHASARARLRAD